MLDRGEILVQVYIYLLFEIFALLSRRWVSWYLLQLDRVTLDELWGLRLEMRWQNWLVQRSHRLLRRVVEHSLPQLFFVEGKPARCVLVRRLFVPTPIDLSSWHLIVPAGVYVLRWLLLDWGIRGNFIARDIVREVSSTILV